MGLIEKSQILAMISPPVDQKLSAQLVDEFVSLESRFIQRDWGPAELDGGQFCEALGRILYHLDSNNLNRTKELKECLEYIENNSVAHHITPRHDAIHVAKVLHVVYKFRSQRGAVHITPSYTPNHMDSKFIVEGVRWAMAELIRMISGADRELVAKAIRELLRFDVPAIGKFDEVIMVQRTDLTPEEEILVLLHFAGEEGFSRTEIGKYAMRSAPRITENLKKLTSPNCREVVLVNARYRLTDIGAKRVRESLSSKLLVQ